MAENGADRPAPSLVIRLFGRFEVRLEDQPLPSLRTRKGEWLLAWLTLHHGREVERASLAGTLWPDSPGPQAFSNLRRCLTDLRAALGREARRLRSPTPHTVCLDLSGAEADVLTFDQALARGDDASLEMTVGLRRGPLLAECPEEWVVQEREAREQAYLTALETLAGRAMERGDPAAAVRAMRQAVAVDPFRETTQRTLMQALVTSGDYAGATLAYRDFCLLLQRELNAAPAPETTALFAQIRAESRSRALRPAGAAFAAAPCAAIPLTADLSARAAPGDSTAAAMHLAAPRVALLAQSHAQPDEQLLQRLAAELRASGHEVFVDQPGATGVAWAQEMERQVRAADVVVPLLSAASIHSETLAYEVEIAHAAGQQHGRPRLLPVRVNDVGPLPEPLASILCPLEQVLWRGPEDDARVLTALPKALQGSPAPASAPASVRDRSGEGKGEVVGLEAEPVSGPVPLRSKFYVVRPADAEFHGAMARQDSLVLVKGARQMGKTSLLARGLQQAREAGARILLTDFQALNAAHLESAEAFCLTLAQWIADQLAVEVPPDACWNARRGPSLNLELFLRREVLDKMPGLIVWGLDEVDRLFPCSFGSEVFGLFRSWHNRRMLEPDGPWTRLTLAMAYATEAHLFITDMNQSPFNVGTRLTLEDFTLLQVADLNRRCALPLRDEAEVARFYRLVGGHPYLVRRGLHALAHDGLDIAALEAQAAHDEGIFGDHLRRLLLSLARDPDLCEVMRGVLRGQPCPTAESFYRLRSAGVLAGESQRDASPRCQLYATYLEQHLFQECP